MGSEGIHEASRRGDEDAVAALMGAGVDLNGSTDEKGDTALHWACRNLNAGIVRRLLTGDNRAAVNVINRNGLTPLGVFLRNDSVRMNSSSEANEILRLLAGNILRIPVLERIVQ